MSKTVDQRVVEMRFDNSNFETNAKTTMSTLDKLKAALNFSSSSESFKQLSKASQSVDMSPLSSAVETVQAKFSALEVVSLSVLSNIANKAVDAGTQLIKSLTIDQVTEGWSKYEQKVQAVQTIVSQGYDYDLVNAQLEKLNWFTDETSYSFSDMVSNIGKFTAQGQDLNDSVTAMEGISNWAALSGAGITGAARAMYNLSQALGVGSVKVQDWMSIENANMATKEFKETVIETAQALGNLSDTGEILKQTNDNYTGDAYVSFSNFRSTLAAGWFDSDVLMAALEKYGSFTDELNSFVSSAASDSFTASVALQIIDEYLEEGGLSAERLKEISEETGYSVDYLNTKLESLSSTENELGRRAFKAAQEATTLTQAINSVKDAASTAWMNIFETVFGGYDEARVTWTDLANNLYDIFVPSLTGINDYLSGEMNSSWQKMKSIIAETGLSSSDFAEALEENMKAAGVKVDYLVDEFGSFEAALKNTPDAAKYVSETLLDYVAVLDAMGEEELEAEGITEDQIEVMKSLADTTSESNSEFYGLIDTLDELGGKELLAQALNNALTGIIELLGTIKQAFSNIFPPLAEKKIYNMIVKIEELSQKLILSEESLGKVERAFSGLFAILDMFKQVISAVASAVLKVLKVSLDGAGSSILDLAANTGDMLVSWDQTLKDGGFLVDLFDDIADKIIFVIDKIKELIKKVKESEFINDMVSNLKDLFYDLKDAITGASDEASVFTKIFDTLSEVKSTVINSLNESVNNLSTDVELAKTATATEDYASKVTTVLESLIDKYSETKLTAKSVFNAIIDTFSENVEVDWGTTVALGSNAGMIIMLREMNKTLTSFTEIVPTFGKYFNTLTKTLSSCAKKLTAAKSFEILSQGVRNIALSILVLAGAMFVLSKIDTDRFWEVVGVVSGFTLAMSLLVILMASLSKSSKEAVVVSLNVSTSFIAISASILILAAAIQVLKDLDLGQLLKGGGTILVLLSVVFYTAQQVAKFQTSFVKNLGQLALMFLGMAAAIDMLAVALTLLAGIKPGPLLKGFAALISIMVAFSVMAYNFLQISGKANAKAILSLMTISISLFSFAVALKWIGQMDFSGIVSNIPVLIGILASFAAMMLVSKLAGENAAKAAVAILSMTSSIAVLAIGIRLLSGIDSSEVTKAAAIMSGIMIILGIVVALSHFSGENAAKAGLMLIELAGSLAIISIIIAIVGKLDAKTLLKGVGVVAALVAVMSGLVYITGFAKYADKLKGVLIKFVAIIAVLSFCIISLSALDTVKALGAAGSLALVVAALGVLMYAFGQGGFKNADQIKWPQKFITILYFTTVLGALGILIDVLAAFADPKTVVPIAEGIALLLVALSGSLWILSNMNENFKGVKAYIGLTAELVVIMTALGVLITVLSNITENPENLLPLAASISTLLLALTVCLTILSLPIFNASSLTGWVFGSILAMGVVMAGLGWMLSIMVEKITDIDKVLPIATAISELALALAIALPLLALAGSFGTAAFIGILGMIVAIGAIIVLSMLIGSYGDKYKTYIDKGMPVLKQLAEGFIDLAGYFLDTIIDSFIDAIPKLGDALSSLSEKLKPFTDYVSTLDSSIITGTGCLVAMFAELGAGEIISAIQNLIGIKDFDGFETKLESFGEAISTFITTLKDKGITSDDVTLMDAAATAGKKLVEITKAIGNGDIFTIFSTLVGTTSFVTGLETFGLAIVGYSHIIANMDIDAVEASNEAVNMLVSLANNLPETKTLSGWFSSSDSNHLDLVDFGQQLLFFGSALVGYSAEVKLLDTDAVSASVTAAGMLNDLANELPETKNLKGWFSGADSNHLDLVDFGDQLTKFGSALVKYSWKVILLDSDAVEKSVTAAKMLVDLSNTLPATKTLKGWFSSSDPNHMDMGDFGEQLEKFGDGLKKYSKKIKDIDDDIVTKTESITNALVNLTDNLPEAKSISGWLNGSNKTSLKDFAEQVAAFGEQIKKYDKQIKDVSTEKMNNVSDSVGKLVTALEEAEDIKANDKLYKIGQDAAQGFINGVNSKIPSVKTAGTNLGNSLSTSTKKALNEHSPSKVFEQIGEYAGEGLIDGIKSTFSSVVETAKSLKDSVTDGFSGIAETIKDEVMDAIGIDSDTFTITPVLDLSEIQNQTSDLTSMLGDYSSLDLGSSYDLSSITASAMSSYNSSASYDSLAETIKGLTAGNVTNEFNNTFDVSGYTGSTDELATRISELLQTQVERSGAVWA